MNQRSTLNIKLIAQILFAYHLFSATAGIFLLSPVLYLGMRNSEVTRIASVLLIIVLYIPFLLVTYGFLKFKKWAYFFVLFFYGIEIFQMPPFFNFKLSFFHHSLAVTFKGVELGVDFISLSIFIFLILIGRNYLAHTERATAR